MKLYSIVILAVLYDCSDEEAVGSNLEDDYGFDKNLNLVGLQKNYKEIVYRPCDLRDIECIREFFAKNSRCSIAKGPAPDPLIFERNTVYLPFANITVVLKNKQISGLNDAKIKEFYVNKNTGNLVIAIDVRGLTERSPETIFKYQRTGKEPIILKDYTTVTYELITFTAVIPQVPHLQLHKADIHANIADANPPYAVGSKAYTSSDPAIQKSFTVMTAALPVALRESLLLKSSLYVLAIIQYNICDFGIPILSV